MHDTHHQPVPIANLSHPISFAIIVNVPEPTNNASSAQNASQPICGELQQLTSVATPQNQSAPAWNSTAAVAARAHCSFWDPVLRKWSEAGCHLAGIHPIKRGQFAVECAVRCLHDA